MPLVIKSLERLIEHEGSVKELVRGMEAAGLKAPSASSIKTYLKGDQPNIRVIDELSIYARRVGLPWLYFYLEPVFKEETNRN